MKQLINILRLNHFPIVEQLRLEEALLRADDRNWCIINQGTPPAIVMGISGKAEQLIDQSVATQRNLPVIRRFSGGGTVVVDSNTIFVTWICNVDDIGVTCCPCKIHEWASSFYQRALPTIGMSLRENDYVIGEKKWGGNAQYLCKGRWLHHTSILWDYDPEVMRSLLLPQKMPSYRQGRSHLEFLCCLSDYLPSRESFEKGLLSAISTHFDFKESFQHEVDEVLARPHRKSTGIYSIHAV